MLKNVKMVTTCNFRLGKQVFHSLQSVNICHCEQQKYLSPKTQVKQMQIQLSPRTVREKILKNKIVKTK